MRVSRSKQGVKLGLVMERGSKQGVKLGLVMVRGVKTRSEVRISYDKPVSIYLTFNMLNSER